MLHVIVRFFTVPKVSDARKSAGYALLFIALLYTTAPAVGAFARLNFVDTVHNTAYNDIDSWLRRNHHKKLSNVRRKLF